MTKMDDVANLIERFLGGEEPSRVLASVDALGSAKAAVFGFALAHRLHEMPGGRDIHFHQDFSILCTRAGVDDNLLVRGGSRNGS